MSEQTIQNNLYSIPVTILDKYTCLSLGATTIKDLIKAKELKDIKVSKNLGRRPDVLIVNKNKEVVVFIEFKKPEEFNTDTKKKKAISQEIDVAKEIGAKIYVVSDGDTFLWLNPITKNFIVDDKGNKIKREIKPKSEAKKLADFIDLVSLSVTKDNDKILKLEDIDPTDLAKKIAGILKRMTFASAKMSLYTFVEVFLFKYLSDINVLQGDNSFSRVYSLYNEDKSIRKTDADILGAYLEGPRAQMKLLFPEGKDGTTIVNGQIFHVKKGLDGHYIEEDSHALCFKSIMDEFAKYEKQNGKLINISKDFKSKLFETFMKNSEDKSDMGQFFTPLKIVKEMVDMVTVTNGMKICDPASGVGKFLLEAAANVSFEIKNGKLASGVTLCGLEKQMSGRDDITTILAKANMLIYFSKLFKDNNDVKAIQYLSENLLNKTFYSSKKALGTLENLKENEYDLILANPPYYQDATISKLASDTGFYKSKGNGVEALFLEWIVRSLKYGGTANVVLPDGIFTNLGNTNLKQLIIDTCYIESIISLPVGSFFNTPKKTYILTLHKKSEEDINDNKKQDYKVFTYICKSIGEELNVNRFDTPDDNDLHNAVVKYNSYKNIQNKNDIQEPFKGWFDADGKMKLLSIDNFSASENWNIDNFWSDEEKISLGFKEADNQMTLDEFKSFCNELVNDITNYKEAIECLM
ncbi:TPA: SAM-dependent methyltransferase [Candidatus Gastranaerophilales bacterium HUM_2]|jgi:N-6 DNA methylase|nr:MAG TPA: SAM-dependent methyltransferase [Candidatus Gastranaerophilales bacterium HUM_2]